MPVFNAERYLKEAIDSILSQSYAKFEFLIINDGSTDNSEAVISSYSDSRIRYYKNEANLGLIATLNKGITLAKGKYIARMDADDISLPNRLELQIDLMEQRSLIGVCGTWTQHFQGTTELSEWKSHNSHEAIKVALLNGTALSHPTVVIRKSELDKLKIKYNPQALHVEDYELWTRLIFNTQFHTLPEILLKYRVHDQSISKKNEVKQKELNDHIRLTYYEKIFKRPLKTHEKNAILSSWNSPNAIDVLLNLTKMVLRRKTLLKKQGIQFFYWQFLATILNLSKTKEKNGLTLKKVFPYLLYSYIGFNTKKKIVKLLIK